VGRRDAVLDPGLLEGPTFAQVDPATPHLHTAGVMPERRPTPLWDAFLAAVWPDPEIRRWAVRVLSIALTGYADRACRSSSARPAAGRPS
jgi:hypothetical protein